MIAGEADEREARERAERVLRAERLEDIRYVLATVAAMALQVVIRRLVEPCDRAGDDRRFPRDREPVVPLPAHGLREDLSSVCLDRFAELAELAGRCGVARRGLLSGAVGGIDGGGAAYDDDGRRKNLHGRRSEVVRALDGRDPRKRSWLMARIVVTARRYGRTNMSRSALRGGIQESAGTGHGSRRCVCARSAFSRTAYFASGSGLTWKCTTSGFVPLPPSLSHGVRSPLGTQSPRPFQPALGSSMRPSKPFA